ncbi:MAG: hypothetical protein RSD06_04035 [Bacilli bacterium]
MSKVTSTSNEVKKTLTIVDRSTKALNTAADAVVKAAQDLQNISTASTQLTQDIEFKQSELDSLEEQLATKQREQAAELRLRVKENADIVLAELLKERGLITTTTKDVKDVEAQLAKALAENTAEIESAIAHTTAEVTSVFKAQLFQKDSEHKVEIASLKANATAAQERITFLTAELAQARAQVEADRTARVEIAKAEAQRQGVVVNANGK